MTKYKISTALVKKIIKEREKDFISVLRIHPSQGYSIRLIYSGNIYIYDNKDIQKQ